MSDLLTPLPAFERLSERVFRILGLNPGKFTLQGTNTYLVGTGKKRLLIDTGEGKPEYIESLVSVLKELGDVQISGILLTHWHYDHVNGVPGVLEMCDQRGMEASPTLHKKKYPERDSAGLNAEDVQDGQVFSVEGATLTAYHTPGHAEDHLVFMLGEEAAMFSGDNVLGQGTAVFENLKDYVDSLSRMLSLKPNVIYPGHGPVVADGAKTLQDYIKHREAREKEILSHLQVIQEDPSYEDKYVSALQLVKIIYSSYPKEIYAAAEKVVTLQLEKLYLESRVVYKIRENSLKVWSLSNADERAAASKA
ncbi:metallo-beta-lactamase superfamily protein [Basidiobolus meristosporus CBS 931.73]|uniref:Metallo-beta-lactamase superfamily protein n=1 Tax=Basidiobolus meristosporus CBS 931.73 TaxID=1314790 RepID=A0A1Y1Y284_9FUNG|nr:metallo-beta-lactamase superfamily protein [Basidiobolus meristosporus CBS 931.73]|eukprot:ORX91836.1 metallo-beta-lactamase superfamily protein [Basidiobolus meristosporus CBS 931.73]